MRDDIPEALEEQGFQVIKREPYSLLHGMRATRAQRRQTIHRSSGSAKRRLGGRTKGITVCGRPALETSMSSLDYL